MKDQKWIVIIFTSSGTHREDFDSLADAINYYYESEEGKVRPYQGMIVVPEGMRLMLDLRVKI